MTPTEHPAKTPSRQTGPLALLSHLLRARGNGASSFKLLALLVLTASALLVLTATPALALETRVVTESFGEAGPGPGRLDLQAPDFSTKPPRVPGSGLAINQASHDIYVADTGNGRVAQFEADGTFVRSFGALTEPTFIAVDNSGGTSQGDLYVADSATGSVSKFEADGTPVTAWGSSGVLSGFSEIVGIAVGPGGDLFVLDENQVLHRYEEGGTPVGSPVSAPRGSFPGGLAADTEANLYKVTGAADVTKFSAAGALLSFSLDARQDGLGLGVDPSNNDLYVIQGGEGASFLNRFAVGCGEACTPLESFGTDELRAPAGVAVDATTHRVYVTDAGTSEVDVFEAATVPAVTATAVAQNLGTSAVVAGEVNPDGIALTECAFEYVTQAAFEQSGFFDLSSGGSAACEAPDAAEIPTDEAFHPVHATLSGLTPNTAYRFRLRAANAQGSHRSQSLPLTTFGPAAIDSTSLTEVSATAATLEAELNPHGLPTTYRFEYDTVPYTEGGGSHGESTPTASAGSGTADVARSAQIAGLQPATAYHFRVVAENSLGTTEGPDRSFTTQPASASSLLPDSRGYELVSPPDKHGAPLEGLTISGGIVQAAADGNGLAYIALSSVDENPAGNRGARPSQLLATRVGPGSWSTADVATPHRAPAGTEVGSRSEYRLFSQDLSRAAVAPAGTTPLSPLANGEYTPYLREAEGTYVPLVYPGNVPEGTMFGGTESSPELFSGTVSFITATPDLSHVLLRSPTSLVQGIENEGQESDYVWSDGALTQVSLIPPGAATVCGGSACLSAGEEGRSSAVGNNDFQVRNAISADGSRVVFDTVTGVPSNSPSLYLRDLTSGETLALDAAQPGAEGESGGATFQDASTDGSRVFFTDGHRLTVGSTAGGASEPDLYMCQVEETPGGLTCQLTDLTANTVDPAEPAAVQGAVIGATEDGSSVYFVANGALTESDEGAVTGDCRIEAGVGLGECNLYRTDVATNETRLIAVLSGADFPAWAPESAGQDLGKLTARVSPNGRYLAFMSQRPLTGYDNRDARSGQRDEEVFLYDAATEALRCASCDPTGARPTGVLDHSTPGPLIDRPHAWESHWLAASLPGWVRVDEGHALYQPRYLSDSGRLFFNSPGPLSPTDVNGTQDVYTYEPPGLGSCAESSPTFSTSDGGCLNLISSGTSTEESAFLDASESGEDAFFLTAARLTGRDVDSAYDVYDARVNGGEPEPAKPVECSGDACQQPAVPPNDPTPGSLTFNGAGNLLQCPQGKVRRSGRCVARKHAKKHHKRKGHKRHQRANSNHGGHK